MADLGKMGTDLVGFSGNQMHLQKRRLFSPGDRLIFSLDFYASFRRIICDRHLIGLVILSQISAYSLFFGKIPFYQATVILSHTSIPKPLAESLQSGQTFPRCHDPAGIPVQTVAD